MARPFCYERQPLVDESSNDLESADHGLAAHRFWVTQEELPTRAITYGAERDAIGEEARNNLLSCSSDLPPPFMMDLENVKTHVEVYLFIHQSHRLCHRHLQQGTAVEVKLYH